MLRSWPSTLRPLLAAGFACLCGAQAFAQAEPWIGRWGAPTCARDATTIGFTKARLDLSTFETDCAIRGVRRRGSIFDFDLACTGEGPPSRISLSARVTGDRLDFVSQRGFAFDPKSFQRCR
jgi:hypothetical protein